MKEVKQVPIQAADYYLSKMRLSFVDKSDFMQYLSPEVNSIIDFGCADGSFIKFLQDSFPNYTYYGIDNNDEFLQKAEANLEGRNVRFFRSLQDLYEECELDLEHAHLNMSSVLHEIFAYQKMPRKFLSDMVKIYDFSSISIRDMGYYRKPIMKNYDNDRDSKSCSDSHSSEIRKYGYLAQMKNIAIKIFEKSLTDDDLRNKLTDYIKCNGQEFKSNRMIIEFLLKYFYDSNWERECRESYFIDSDDFGMLVDIFDSYDYQCIVKKFYTLPYLITKWKNDFNLNSRDLTTLDLFSTHRKYFFKKLSKEELSKKYDKDGHLKYRNHSIVPAISFCYEHPLTMDLEDFYNYDECAVREVPAEPETDNDEPRDEWYRNPMSIEARRVQINQIRAQQLQNATQTLDNLLAQIHNNIVDDNYLTTNRIQYMNRQRRYDEAPDEAIPTEDFNTPLPPPVDI